jgi:hypothetical protein
MLWFNRRKSNEGVVNGIDIGFALYIKPKFLQTFNFRFGRVGPVLFYSRRQRHVSSRPNNVGGAGGHRAVGSLSKTGQLV